MLFESNWRVEIWLIVFFFKCWIKCVCALAFPIFLETKDPKHGHCFYFRVLSMMSSRRSHIPGAAKYIGGKIMFNTLSHQLVCLEHASHILGESSFSLSLCSCLTPQNRDLEQHTRRGELELAILSMDLYFSFGCGWGGWCKFTGPPSWLWSDIAEYAGSSGRRSLPCKSNAREK